jgi:cyclic pyranopterin phosphate synthase
MTSRLVDSYGRVHNNLRVSVTDRCNLRCRYCMPEEVTFVERSELLSFEEIARVVRIATGAGINKIRLTGGEPLMRRGLDQLVELLAAIPEITDIGMTTNALLLAEQVGALYAAGLRRLNISLDTLDPERFREITRRDGLERVLAGIEAALETGFSIKLNAVSIRGVTEHEVVPLARYAGERGIEMRFIEYMPIGAEPWQRQMVYFAHEILEQLEQEFGPVVPSDDYDPHAPAMTFSYGEGKGRIGIIASVSRPFCRSCNRIRLTADGKLRNCLFALDEADIRELLRSGASDEAVMDCLVRNVAAKWEGHEINTARFVKPLRTMHAIGG